MKVLDELVRLLPPPAEPVENPEPMTWGRVTGGLGERLPSDFTRFIELYGTGEINGYLTVFNPFGASWETNFFSGMMDHLSGLRSVRAEYPDAVPYPLYFEPGGLLPWGVSMDGDIFCWITDHAISDHWRTVALLRNSSVFEYDTGFAGLLVGGLRGTLAPRCFPPGFASPSGGTFVRSRPLRRRYHTLDVFTDRAFGGNPLAVFLDGRGLSDAQMQRAARELNLSETVFVLPPETAEGTRRLRIFTPGVELPFAGHPTIGTAILLAMQGPVLLRGEETRIVLEEGVGPVPVTIRGKLGWPEFAQLSAAQRPEVRESPLGREELAGLLGVGADEVEEGARAVSCGVPFLIVPLAGLEALGRARVDPARWERLLKDAWAPHVYVWAPTSGGADFRVRMFAPAMGIAEDPATGAAASSFAAYLALREAADGAFRWTVEQGIEMGRPSTLYLEADRHGGGVVAVRVGGGAVLVGGGWMEIPAE